MLKKMITRIVLAFTIIVLTGGLMFGCASKQQSNELFIYKTRNKTEVIILGLTDKAKELETLEIPHEIDGKKVVQLGNSGTWMTEDNANLTSKNLKKVIIPYTVSVIYKDAFSSSENKLKLIINRASEEISIASGNHSATRCFNEQFVEIMQERYGANEPIKEINIYYMYNFDGNENLGYFSGDYVSEGMINQTQLTPSREGYSFGGWYKESECINEWNFSADNLKTEYEKIYLFAKWHKK